MRYNSSDRKIEQSHGGSFIHNKGKFRAVLKALDDLKVSTEEHLQMEWLLP
jgi:hypothetical protein